MSAWPVDLAETAGTRLKLSLLRGRGNWEFVRISAAKDPGGVPGLPGPGRPKA